MSERKARLLVVDDVEDNRDLLARRLTRKGYDVEVADSGQAALDAVARQGFDLILLDIMMPGMSGLEVLETLRKEYTQGELPILMATAKSDSGDIVHALELGANDYVTKPIDFPVVLARVQSHLKVRTEMEQKSSAPAIFKVDGSAEPGTVLDGRYEILSVLGEGGFAVVYRARQLSTGQHVAVKLLRPHRVAALSLASVELARFEREMKTIGKLNHPHVVRLVDSGSLKVKMQGTGGWSESLDGSDDDRESIPPTRQSAEHQRSQGSSMIKVPYLVMEFLEGETLSVLLQREAPLSVPRAVEIALPVLSAVGAAHQLDVIHRDLKPPNIFLTRGHDGRPFVKVLDFGIAKLTGDDSSQQQLTLDEGFVGTPEYMAPEQARGNTEIDDRADQYAIAVMLYEALTGRRPFRSDSFIQLVHAIAKGEFEAPSKLVVGIPQAFEQVLLRAMSATPEDRYTSVEAFGKALLPFALEELRSNWTSAFDVPDEKPASLPPGSPERSALESADTLDGPGGRAAGRQALSSPPSSGSGAVTVPPPPVVLKGPTLPVFWVSLLLAFGVGLFVGARFLASHEQPASAEVAGPSTSAGPTYRVAVRATPEEARLLLDGEEVGTGALERRFARDGREHTLRVEAHGFVPAHFVFRDAPPPAEVVLDAL